MQLHWKGGIHAHTAETPARSAAAALNREHWGREQRRLVDTKREGFMLAVERRWGGLLELRHGGARLAILVFVK